MPECSTIYRKLYDLQFDVLSLKWRPIPTKSVEEHQQIVDSIGESLKIQAHNKARDDRARSRDLLLLLLERFGVKQL